MSSRSSSPDPLAASDGPTVANMNYALTPARPRSSPSKRVPPSTATTHVNVESPRKMTTTSNSILSPWRIKVVVEAERDSDDEGIDSPAGRQGRKGKASARSQTITVPIHGLDEGNGPLSIFADAIAPKPKKAPARKRSQSRGEPAKRTRTRTTTTKVPVKGLESSPQVEPEDSKRGRSKARKPTVKDTPAPKTSRKRATSKTRASTSTTSTKRRRRKSQSVAENGTTATTETEAVNSTEEVPAVVEPEAGERQEPSKTTTRKPRTSRRTATKPQVPTLASTRSRRGSAIIPAMISTPSRSRATSTSLAPESSTRNALSRKDPNHMLSPSPARSIQSPSFEKSSLSLPQNESIESRSLEARREETIDAEEFHRNTVTQSDEALDDLPDLEETPSLHEEPVEDDQRLVDFTYISTGSSYTPRTKKNRGQTPEPSELEPLFRDNSVGVESFYGYPPAEEEMDLDDDEDDNNELADADFTYISNETSYTPRGSKKRNVGLDDDQGEALFDDHEVSEESFYGPRRMSQEREEEDINEIFEEETQNESLEVTIDAATDTDDEEPAEADFTYMSTGSSYTPRTRKKNGLGGASASASPLFEGNPVTEDTFYGLPEANEQRPAPGEPPRRDISLLSSPPQEVPDLNSGQRMFRSSPPFQVMIPPTPRRKALSTGKRTRSPTLPMGDNPPPMMKRRIERETPDISRVVDASSVMSDALDVNEAMDMSNQDFGQGFDSNGPLTPEDSESEMVDAGPHGSEPADYPETLDKGKEVEHPNISGIISPPPSQPPESVSTEDQSSERGNNTESRYFREIFKSPGKEPRDSSLGTPDRYTPATEDMNWASTGSARTPGGRSVHFADEEPPLTRPGETSSYANRAAQLEDEWEQERREVARRAREVGAITINSDDEEEETDSNATHSDHGSERDDEESEETGTDESLSLEEQYARERSQVRKQAAEVGAITIDSSSILPDEPGLTILQQDTAAFEQSLARHIAEEEGAVISTPVLARKSVIRESSSSSSSITTSSGSIRSKPATNVFTTRSELSSRPTSPPTVATTGTGSWGATTASEERARLFTAVNTPANISVAQNMLPDDLVSSINNSSTTSDSAVDDSDEESCTLSISHPEPSKPDRPVWTNKHYQHVDAIFQSRGTKPIQTGIDPETGEPIYLQFTINVLFDMLITPDMMDELDMDENAIIALMPKESATVLRFMEREKRAGTVWTRLEVLRRVAGMIVADARRRVTGREARWERA